MYFIGRIDVQFGYLQVQISQPTHIMADLKIDWHESAAWFKIDLGTLGKIDLFLQRSYNYD